MNNVEQEQLGKELGSLAVSLLDLRVEQHRNEANAQMLKEIIYKHLVENGIGEFIITAGEEEEIVIRNNVRLTRPFDKDGLSDEARVDRDELHYAGLAGLVSRGRLDAHVVAKYQTENQAQFVTVRTRKPKKKKKGKVTN
jgi:hypothetical protein